MLTNKDIENLCDHYDIPLKGVYCKDELPSQKMKDGDYVVNLQSMKDGGGTHWTFLKVKKDKAVWFDSFGAPPPEDVLRFIKKRKCVKIGFNNWIVQDLSSKACGFYVCLVMLFMEAEQRADIFHSLNAFVDMFGEDTKANEKLLREIWREQSGKGCDSIIRKLFRSKK